ncbi:MAG: endo alpha-1,4 polygalactosaminidase [Candidatus Marinimicrobia bacterium]|nr:endo alpha-1,4 polygalactosaminidase [Candidatus Neomarinimicrobiota bacterium]
MRDFVRELSAYSKNVDSTFIIIPQNGQELITDNGEGDGIPQTSYLNAIDATGRENLYYGYNNNDEATPEEDKQQLLNLCLLCKQYNVEVLTIDYCSTHSKMDSSYYWNETNGFISFAADQRDLNNIPDYPATIDNENLDDITSMSQAKNFLYLINSENFNSKQDFINAASATNYDVVIMDLYHNELTYVNTEIEQLKTKQNGGKRLVICYMSIGEAEDYRYYWRSGWKAGDPAWLERENPDWGGNYKVRYWEVDWQSIIYGNDSSYTKKILDAGFNGVYLDIIDAFEYFEE